MGSLWDEQILSQLEACIEYQTHVPLTWNYWKTNCNLSKHWQVSEWPILFYISFIKSIGFLPSVQDFNFHDFLFVFSISHYSPSTYSNWFHIKYTIFERVQRQVFLLIALDRLSASGQKTRCFFSQRLNVYKSD